MTVICINSIFGGCCLAEGERYQVQMEVNGKFSILDIDKNIVHIFPYYEPPIFIEVIENCLAIWKKEEII